MNDKELIQAFEQKLEDIKYPIKAKDLYIPIKYTLESGGKRLRPLLCMRACEAMGSDALSAINQAMGIEMFHNFTLIHDDVMDESDMRRGRPTVFSRWNSTQAILSGDALLTLATRKVIEDCDPTNISKILDCFNTTALEVYEGQQLDMDFEKRDDVTTDEYLEMIRLKTSVLLGCACAIGVYVSERGCEFNSDALYKYGECLGLAFQLRDDWLDTYGDPEEFGKSIGGDIRNRKKTWLFITACNEAPKAMSEALNSSEDEIVGKVKEIYDSLNLSERCDKMIQRYCDDAINSLKNISMNEFSKNWFVDLAYKLCKRTK